MTDTQHHVSATGGPVSVNDLLPAWVPWLGPAVVVALTLVSLAITPGYPAWSVRRRVRPAMHWTRRAELATEARGAFGVAVVFTPMMTAAWVASFNGPFSAIPDWALVALAAVLALATVVFGSWWLMRSAFELPLPALGPYLSRLARKWLPAAVLVVVALVAPARLDSPWMVPWTVVAVAALWGLRYLAELFVVTGVAEPAKGRVAAAVERAATRMDTAPPAAFVLDGHMPNAFALPVRGQVIMTERLVDELDDAELEAVALHEIAHLNERPAVTRRRSLSMLTYLPVLTIKPLLAGGPLLLMGALAAGVALRMIVVRLDGGEERRADSAAVAAAHEATALGTGLLKMHRIGLIPAFLKRDPHGPLHERLQRAGVGPDYEPFVDRARVQQLIVAAALTVVLGFGTVVGFFVATDIWDGERGTATALAFGWNAADLLWWQGTTAAAAGDYARAVTFLSAAEETGYAGAGDELARTFYLAGRCEEGDVAVARFGDRRPVPDYLVTLGELCRLRAAAAR